MNSTTPPSRSSSGHLKILMGLATGIVLGLVLHVLKSKFGDNWQPFVVLTRIAEPIGLLFLRMMQMVVLPLVISALYLAVVDVGDLKRLGRIGLTTLLFTAILSFSAVIIGVVSVNVVRPGAALSEEARDRLAQENAKKAEEGQEKADAAKPFGRIIVDMLPENPIQEMAGALDGSSPGNGMLAVMVFALLCGVAATFRPDETASLTAALRGLYEISMVIIGWALKLAPIGAGCLVFGVAAKMGFDILKALAVFVAVVIGGLLIQLVVVYSSVLKIFGGISPLAFFRKTQEAMVVAFTTSSSSATLSTSMKVAQDQLKLSPQTANFVLTVGATGNQNGTALFEGVVVLFLAQVFKVDLSLGQQLIVVLMAVLAGVGTAGVPGGSIPLIIVVLRTVGVPPEGIAIILGVDRLLDMSRTLVNVVGDLVVATCVDSWNRAAR